MRGHVLCSRQAYDLISQGFGPGANGPLAVVVKLPKQSASDNQTLLTTMTKDVAATSGVASVTPATVNQAGTTALFSVIPTTRPQATATENLVNRLRDDVLSSEHATSYVTGTTAETDLSAGRGAAGAPLVTRASQAT